MVDMVDGDDGRGGTKEGKERKQPEKTAVVAPAQFDALPQIPQKGVSWFVSIGRDLMELFDRVIVDVEAVLFEVRPRLDKHANGLGQYCLRYLASNAVPALCQGYTYDVGDFRLQHFITIHKPAVGPRR